MQIYLEDYGLYCFNQQKVFEIKYTVKNFLANQEHQKQKWELYKI